MISLQGGRIQEVDRASFWPGQGSGCQKSVKGPRSPVGLDDLGLDLEAALPLVEAVERFTGTLGCHRFQRRLVPARQKRSGLLHSEVHRISQPARSPD